MDYLKEIFNLRSKDPGMALTPWILLYFFVAVFLFLLVFTQNLHIATKYQVQDALACAALAGEVADLSVHEVYQDIVITDLDYAKEVFEDSLRASLNLSEQGYPHEQSAYFDSSVPVQITELTVYNVSRGQVFSTNLLQSGGTLQYTEADGLAADSRCILRGNLQDGTGNYLSSIQMLDGEIKEIKNTSLYAKISFGVRSMNGNTVMVEKDILTDIQQNE